MKRLIPAIAFVLGWASAAWAAPPATLTTLRQVHALSNPEASKGIPVSFEATVTYIRGYERTLFVQDGDVGIFVLIAPEVKLAPGDRVLVRGKTQASFRPIAVGNDITLLHHGAVPKSLPTSYSELVRAQFDCMLVTVHGVVRAAGLASSSNARSSYLQISADGGYINAVVESNDVSALKDLLDAEVEVNGVAAGEFDNKMQLTGVKLHIATMADVKILKRANASPWSLPVTPMGDILRGYRVNDLTQRIRVHGTITYYQPGAAVVLQDGAKSLWIITLTHSDLRIGDIADATGFPDTHDGFLILTHSEIQDSHIYAPIAPLASTWQNLTLNDFNVVAHVYDLVSIEGQVIAEAREASQDEYVLISGGHLLSAIYRHSNRASAIPPPEMKIIPLGSKVRVSGICTLDNPDPFNGPVPFDILLRSFDDIEVVSRPSWLNIANLTRIVIALLLAVIAAGAWGAILMRKVHRQTTAMAARTEIEAALERRRSRILEDINGSEPLAGILEEIAEMVSFQLKGALCWCEITDGARLGICPPEAAKLRIVREEISARSGPPLGVLLASFDPLTESRANESEALSNGARLATLAIESRRLYSDLLHRSEFDLLTDIHNRFSLEKRLDALIDEARQKAGIFGLIYIDLDDFKQVNDLYGHRVGDQYLQEVALRMKRQLRPHDTLARLGGDEFAVLLPMVRNRAGVKEIAQRLERSFDEPFAIEEQLLHGLASVGIALYPEDGATKDGLLNAADAAMYDTKKTKKQAREEPAVN
jgi:diguanylate cyclase (GGDEF)-like protein